MARDATPLLPERLATPGLDVFAVFGGYHFPEDPDESSPVHVLTVLLDLRPQRSDASIVFNLHDAFNGVTEHYLRNLDQAAASFELMALLDQLPHATINVVVVLSEHSPEARLAVQGLLEPMTRAGQHTLSAVVAVAADTQPWGGTFGLHRFVLPTRPGELATAACLLFKLFASLTAPVALCELDVEDILACTGTADAPALVLSGSLLEGPSLDFSGTENARLASQVPAAVLCPLWNRPRAADVRSLGRAWEQATGGPPAAMSAVKGFWRFAVDPEDFASVAILYVAPALEAKFD